MGRKGAGSKIIPGIVLVALVVVIGIIFFLPGTKSKTSMELASIISKLSEMENMSADAIIAFEIGDVPIELDTQIYALRSGEISVYAIDDGQNAIYLYDGIVFLKNGRAFQLSEAEGDVWTTLGAIGTLYQFAEVEKTKEQDCEIYTIGLEKEKIQADITTSNGELQSICVSSDKNISVYLSNFSKLEDYEYAIPSEVLQAMKTVDKRSLEVLGEDLYRLICAGMNFGKNEHTGTVTYDVSCGMFEFKTQLPWSSIEMNTTEITNPDEIAQMPALIYTLFLNGEFSCEEQEDSFIYRLSLDEETMQEYAGMIAPDVMSQVVTLISGNINIVIKDEQIKSIEIDIDGTVSMILVEVDAAIGATFEFE